MEKYYANNDSYGNCLEECKKLKSDTCFMRIGSIGCTKCEYSAGHGENTFNEVEWIKCKCLDEATGKIVDEM